MLKHTSQELCSRLSLTIKSLTISQRKFGSKSMIDFHKKLKGYDFGGQFEFASPKVIQVGRGVAQEVLKSLPYRNILLVTSTRGVKGHRSLLNDKCIYAPYVVNAEPSVESVRDGVNFARESKCDAVVAIGGGSCIDTGKIISALVTNPGDVMDYVEVIGFGKKITNPAIPFIAVPTTSGTGAECTKNAVVKSNTHKLKASIRSDYMMPAMAIIDPLLILSAPPAVTAHTGMDALCQCMEPFVSHKANPFTDAFARDGIIRASRSLRVAFNDGSNLDAREDMALASVMGGLALANAKLGAVHGFAGVLGGFYETAPHGAICAAILPHAFRANAKALARDKGGPNDNGNYGKSYERHLEVARILVGADSATLENAANWLEEIASDLKIPKLKDLCGIVESDFEDIIKHSMISSSMQGNPIKLSRDELWEILEKAS